MVKPISPNEVSEAKLATIPDKVIEIFNRLIVERWNGSSSTILQDDAVAWIASTMDVDRSEIFSKGWLDVEDIYRKVGWKVEYDKPAYCESYKANFTFRK